jgi:hypothetical protein
MGSILLHNPVVHLYLLFAASLAIVHVWDYLYPAPADRGHPQGEPAAERLGKEGLPRTGQG